MVVYILLCFVIIEKAINKQYMEKRKLNNGLEMPDEGFGVFQITDYEECKKVVKEAICAGYRLIDTASVYKNEEAVGDAVAESGIPREEIFLTSKAWINEMGYENTKTAFSNTLKRLKTGYLDLYLIHMPFGDYYGAWRAMEELYKEGKIKAIGVCNFNPDRLIDLCHNSDIIPAINQVEIHPFHQQTELLKIMSEYGVQPEAWAPFAEGINNIFGNELLQTIAAKHNKTTGQVILRWNIQRGIIVIPKSVHNERIKENFNVRDFELDREDMLAISSLDQGHSFILNVLSVDEVNRLYGIK